MELKNLFTDKFLEILNRFPNHLLTIQDMLAVMAVSVAMSIFIFWVYKKTFQGVLYSRTYNIALMMICLITAMVIMTISSNIILSLGMVGALSIVRFRTAIKDPVDVVFMFWAIAVGIANGAGFFTVSVGGSLVIALMLFFFTAFRARNAPYLLIVKYDPASREKLREGLAILKKYKIKSKVVSREEVELTLEVRVRDNDTGFVNQLSEIEGVQNVVLISITETTI